MKLFIPTIGTKLRLTEDWTPTLIYETRNHDAWAAFELANQPNDRWHSYRDRIFLPGPGTISVPKDTTLIVDRIYIRKGAGEFDSITFVIVDSPNKRLVTKKYGGTFTNRQCRFWVSLDDDNKIFAEVE